MGGRASCSLRTVPDAEARDPLNPIQAQGVGNHGKMSAFHGVPGVSNDILPYPMPYSAGTNGNHNGIRRTPQVASTSETVGGVPRNSGQSSLLVAVGRNSSGSNTHPPLITRQMRCVLHSCLLWSTLPSQGALSLAPATVCLQVTQRAQLTGQSGPPAAVDPNPIDPTALRTAVAVQAHEAPHRDGEDLGLLGARSQRRRKQA